ncbi:SusC/RagA family TonB-linked outer membrane protein [Runella sp. CRIBMP]|uniref:SusC/RagA family TonB-linked outer membrane protein n=1 Tax=Runella sp. CRIBMP TaxID=2683261 RepID=UPI0014120FB4|nr:TonB-dependent receptor [Runella sp. CRIBMP]NBB20727.1 SusC/RagA family TonB-linked outer membrane protein [Runella sp. CRIBMP]
MRKFLLAGVCLLMSICVQLRAQERTVTGTVTSSDDGSPLPGVSVLVKGTTKGTNTDSEGKYRISLPAGAQLVFSYVGFMKSTVDIGAKSVVDVALSPDDNNLNEVVVTAYGGSTAKKNLTSAVAQVSGKTIENLPLQSVDRALQGRAAGVQVTALSGQPGGGINVRVRGVGSINAGNEPLYIIDGVQVASGGLSSTASSNVLASLNPNDIESIQVLKDAAGSAIYGAQGANGVVLISTKRGKAGKTKFTVSYQEGSTQLLKKLDVLTASQFATLKIEGFVNRALATNQSVETARANAIAQYGDPATVQNTDWQDYVFRTGRLRSINASAAGGDGKTNFRLSTAYDYNAGQVIKSDFGRGTVRLNVDHQATKKLKFETSIGLAATKQNGAIADGAFINSPFFAAALILPGQPVYKEDGSYNAPLTGAFSYNPVQSVEYETRLNTTVQTVSNFALNYEILPGLKFRSFYGIDYANNRDDAYRDPIVPQFASTGGSSTVNSRYTLNWNTAQTLSWNKLFANDHDVTLLGGGEYREEVRETVTATGQGFPNGLFRTLAAAARPITTTGTYTTWRIASLFGSANYSFKEKYLATATLRYDGSSRFGANTRYGLFPAASVGYRLSEESFMKGLGWLSELKIFAGYGKAGNNNIDNFASRALFGLGGQYIDLPGVRPSQLGNANLSWEVATTINAGVNYSLFNGRIYGEVQAYRKVNDRLLLSRPLPDDSGFGSIFENLGKVENKGLEIEFNHINVNRGGFKWETNWNVSFQRNKILQLLPGQDRIGTGLRVGEPIAIHWYPTYAGANPADGRSMWLDTLGNITYTVQARDSRVQGTPLPKGFGGVTNRLSYKGLSLEFFLQGQWGNKLLNNNGFFMESSASAGWNNLQSQLDRWTTPGQITRVPRAYEGGTEPGSSSLQTFSTKQLENGGYVRLKQVTLSYDLPSRLVKKAGMSRVNVFAQAINLLTWTAYTGFDPEVLSIELGTYPQSKQITGGIQIEF